MRISVVVIVFNLEPYIGQAIDSVLGQSRAADEVIVVDDCSTDRSAEVVKSYGDKVRYLRMPANSGALLAALHGVKAASGDVLCMLDGDDYWDRDKLAVVEREFRADAELMLLSHDHVRVDELGAELGIRDETHANIAAVLRRAASADDLSNQLKKTILEQRGYWLGSAYSFRRSLFAIPKFEAQIARFGRDRLRQTYLDLVIAPFLVLTNPAKKVGYSPHTRLFYRIHDAASMAGSITPDQARQLALKGRAINELIDLILKENHASPEHLRRRQLILRHYDYLAALYDGDFARATRLYVRLATGYWNRDQLAKETKRYLAVRLLGARNFLELKQKARTSGSRQR